MTRLASILMVAGLLAASGCDDKPPEPKVQRVTSEDVRRDMAKAAHTAAEYTDQAKEEFQQKLDARLKELDVEMAQLREKGKDLKDEAKVEWDQKMAELQKKMDDLRQKLPEVRNSSAKTWNDVKQRVKSGWDDLERAFRDLLPSSTRTE